LYDTHIKEKKTFSDSEHIIAMQDLYFNPFILYRNRA